MAGPAASVVDVALVVLRRGGAVLLQQRKRPPFPGAWELPGGKVEPGEAPADAALREGQEELGVPVRILGLLAVHEHRYPAVHVRLHAFLAEGEVVLGPGQLWVPLAELGEWDVLEGTRPVLATLVPEPSRRP